MAAEFFGTCQICGREQKSHPHAIAKHGYTIQYGWQMGECFGSKAAPYEKSNDRIMDAIEAAQRYIVQTQERIANLRSTPMKADGTVWTEYSMQRFGDKRTGHVTLALNEKGQVEARDYNNTVVYLSLNNTPKTVEAAARQIADRQIGMLEHSITEAETSIPYMQKRYDDWKPAELKPVTQADRAANLPKIHWEAKRYGRTTGVCVGSANGATAYKQTTTDRSKVTCAACIKELARIDDLPRLKAEQAEKARLTGIKEAQRDMKLYSKWIKDGGDSASLLHWADLLNRATTTLQELTAKAPAAQ